MIAATLFFGGAVISLILEIYFPSYILYHAYEMILFVCVFGLVYIFSSPSSTLLNFLGESIYAAKVYFFSNMLLVFLKIICIDFIGFFFGSHANFFIFNLLDFYVQKN